jgi:hypothetical protein
MTNPRTYIDDIEILTTGQLANYESSPSLAQSVSHITVISQLQKRNEDICNNNTSEREEGPFDDVKQPEQANLTNSEDPAILP